MARGAAQVRRRLPPQVRRSQIIDAARICIAELGLGKATVREIARRSGVSVGTITYHFSSQDDLIVEALREASRSFDEEVVAVMTSDRPARERLRFLVDHALPESPHAVALWRLWLDYWGRAARNPGLVGLQRERYAVMRDLIEETIRDGIQRGEFPSIDTRTVAVELTTILDGVGIQLLSGDAEMTLDRARTFLFSLIESYLQPG